MTPLRAHPEELVEDGAVKGKKAVVSMDVI